MKKLSILVIYTGGTIGMSRDKTSGALIPFDFGKMYEHIPYLKNFDYTIDVHSLDTLIDSSNVSPAFWIKIAEEIEGNYSGYDGFVILHGTDTMSYSASMLSFMLENLAKPVIFTGSQLPMGVIRTDGRDNFINAVEVAAARKGEQPMVPEVAICFENKIFRGNRTTKMNAENFRAFISGNYPLLAEIGVHIRYHTSHICCPDSDKPLFVHKSIDNNVALLKLFPGISPFAVNAVTETPGLRGLVLETYGSGNAPTDGWFLQSLKNAVDKGVIICNVTQCKGGSVEPGRYETSLNLMRTGILGGLDITTESAITKMMYLFGRNYSPAEISELMVTPLRGEMS